MQVWPGQPRRCGRQNAWLPAERKALRIGSRPIQIVATQSISTSNGPCQADTQMKLCLTTAGSSLNKVIKCTVYCTDAAHFQAINSVYARYFPSNPPARSFICVSAWHGPFDVEIDCVATI